MTYREGERVKTPKGNGDVVEDTGDDHIAVLLDSGRFEEFMTYELSRLGLPV